MTPRINSLVSELDEARPSAGSTQNKVDALFGKQPAVIDSIRRARERRVSYRGIAVILSRHLPAGESISAGAVQSWCAKNETT